MKAYDPEKPLDDDTRQRLLERNRWQEVEENDRRFGGDQGGDQASDDQVAETHEPEDDQEDTDSDSDPDDPNDLLKPELRDELDRRGIKYDRRARKAQLVELLRQSEEHSTE